MHVVLVDNMTWLHVHILCPYMYIFCAHTQFNQQNFNAAVGAAGIPPPFMPPTIQGGIPPPPQILASYAAPIPIPSSVPSSSAPNSSHSHHNTTSKTERPEEADDRVRHCPIALCLD